MHSRTERGARRRAARGGAQVPAGGRLGLASTLLPDDPDDLLQAIQTGEAFVSRGANHGRVDRVKRPTDAADSERGTKSSRDRGQNPGAGRRCYGHTASDFWTEAGNVETGHA